MKNLTIAPMMLKGVSKEDAEAKAQKLLERVGLSDRANDFRICFQAVRSRELR